jgi:hypothetical protein
MLSRSDPRLLYSNDPAGGAGLVDDRRFGGTALGRRKWPARTERVAGVGGRVEAGAPRQAFDDIGELVIADRFARRFPAPSRRLTTTSHT